MQFIPNGPDIPEALLEDHEEGKVVFFCGAGISYPAGLPTFSGLVKAVYAELGETCDGTEQEALKSYKYDTTLGLLEQRLPNGRFRVREAIASALKPDLTGKKSTQTHEALLRLSKTRTGATRLITTNFDRVFEEVIKAKRELTNVHAAPLLPVPKNKWDGLIYLHGLLDGSNSQSNLNSLVATSGDFGLAYLVERWAARFVSELFRNYTICFVGYSINDPILRYMMDALAADSMMGENSPRAYAFGSYKRSGEEQAKNEWKTKNVIPILYKTYRNHHYLHETLHAWSNNYRDGIDGKSSIVTRYAHHKPTGSTKQDDFVQRMIWALSDNTGLPAKHFSQLNPVPSIEWLEEFSNFRFGTDDLSRFGVPKSNLFNTPNTPVYKFSLLTRPAPSHLAPRMSLVDINGRQGVKLDRVMEELAKWLAKHLDKTEALFWVIEQGSDLNPRFEWHLKRALEDSKHLTQPMQKLWGFVISGYARYRHYNSGLYGWQDRFKIYGNTFTMRQEFKSSLRPLLRISRPYSFGAAQTKIPIERISTIASVEIILASDHVHSAYDRIRENKKFSDFLPYILTDVSDLLTETLDLMCEAEISSELHDYSYIQLPSISDHSQNKDYNDWTILVTLCRDAWVATLETDRGKAEAMLSIWAGYKHPIFRRLVFFALAQHPRLIPLEKSISWLLSDDGHWLWATSTMREVMRLLVSLGPVLSQSEGKALQDAIIDGPTKARFNEDTSDEEFRRFSNRMRWLRLKKLVSNGCKATEQTQALISEVEGDHPEWELAPDERDEFPMWTSNGEEMRVEQSPKSVRELVEWLRNNPKSESAFAGDNWTERCRDDFRRSIFALLKLASDGQWPPQRWAEALNAWSSGNLATRSWNYAAPSVASMPEESFAEALHAIAWWVEQISRDIGTHDEHYFQIIDRIIHTVSNIDEAPDDISITHAINHPIGLASSSLFNNLFSTEIEDGQGLPEDLKLRFSLVCGSDSPALWLGTVVLAQQVIALYRVDQEWTNRYLIPAFQWEPDAIKAAVIWDSFLHAPRIYFPLLEAIKIPFLAIPDHINELDTQCKKQFSGFLTFIALRESSVFTSTELRTTIAKLPSECLESVAQALFNAAQGAGAQKDEYIEHRVIPFVRTLWPNKQEARTPETFRYFAQLCAISGSAFELAFRRLKDHLGPTEHFDYLISLLLETKLPELHPKEVLTILNSAIPVAVNYLSVDLTSLLNSIEESDSSLTNEIEFHRLSVLSQQFKG